MQYNLRENFNCIEENKYCMVYDNSTYHKCILCQPNYKLVRGRCMINYSIKAVYHSDYENEKVDLIYKSTVFPVSARKSKKRAGKNRKGVLPCSVHHGTDASGRYIPDLRRHPVRDRQMPGCASPWTDSH